MTLWLKVFCSSRGSKFDCQHSCTLGGLQLQIQGIKHSLLDSEGTCIPPLYPRVLSPSLSLSNAHTQARNYNIKTLWIRKWKQSPFLPYSVLAFSAGASCSLSSCWFSRGMSSVFSQGTTLVLKVSLWSSSINSIRELVINTDSLLSSSAPPLQSETGGGILL